MADAVGTALAAAIAGWVAALQADSAAPQPSYSLDGKSVSQQEWRAGLTKLIEDAQNVINQRAPTITWSGPFAGRGWWGS